MKIPWQVAFGAFCSGPFFGLGTSIYLELALPETKNEARAEIPITHQTPRIEPKKIEKTNLDLLYEKVRSLQPQIQLACKEQDSLENIESLHKQFYSVKNELQSQRENNSYYLNIETIFDNSLNRWDDVCKEKGAPSFTRYAHQQRLEETIGFLTKNQIKEATRTYRDAKSLSAQVIRDDEKKSMQKTHQEYVAQIRAKVKKIQSRK